MRRLVIATLSLSFCALPVVAQASTDACAQRVELAPVADGPVDMRAGRSAPADEYFGVYPMSVLAIGNTLRRNGEAIDGSVDAEAATTGPLACVVDSIRSWEHVYPADPWIAKDLLNLEMVYLRAHGTEARDLAARTETWLEHDYPLSTYVDPARLALGLGSRGSAPAERVASDDADTAVAGSASPWDRFEPVAPDQR
jgi:hypothetical protein